MSEERKLAARQQAAANYARKCERKGMLEVVAEATVGAVAAAEVGTATAKGTTVSVAPEVPTVGGGEERPAE